jgi:hypothetical protein
MTIFFKGKDEQYRGINVQFVTNYASNFINTPGTIKIDLIDRRKHLPKTTVYQVESNISFPLE